MNAETVKTAMRDVAAFGRSLAEPTFMQAFERSLFLVLGGLLIASDAKDFTLTDGLIFVAIGLPYCFGLYIGFARFSRKLDTWRDAAMARVRKKLGVDPSAHPPESTQK